MKTQETDWTAYLAAREIDVSALVSDDASECEFSPFDMANNRATLGDNAGPFVSIFPLS